MDKPTFSKKIKERNIGKTFIVYLGGAWVFIEAFNFLIDKYNWNANILNVLILLVIFGLPASLIYTWYQRKFTTRAILFQVLNGILAISIISYSFIKPNSINPTQLRLIKFRENQKMLASQIQSLAILPFGNFTGDESQDILAAGLHDALITELGQIGAIRVISRTSSQAYAKTQKTIKEISSELNVDAVIEASLLEVEDNIRIQLKLINTYPEEQQLWTQTYDTSLRDIPNLYNQILKKISNEIQLTLSPDMELRLNEKREVNPESFKAYLLGMYNIHLETPEGITKGMEYLQEAVRIDPEDAFAYAGLALGYLEIEHGFQANGEGYIMAEEAANQALNRDSSIAEVYGALAELNMYYLRDFDQGERYFKKALQMNPNLAQTHFHYAWALQLFGRGEEAIYEHELAYNIDPLNPYYTAWLGAMYTYNGRNEDGIEKAMESMELVKDYPFGYWILGEAKLAMGLEEEALEAHKMLTQIIPPCKWVLGYTCAKTGHRDEAEAILNELEKDPVSSWNALGLAALYGVLGNADQAYRWLTYEPGHAWVPWVKEVPFLEPIDQVLMDDIRYKEYRRRLDIPG